MIAPIKYINWGLEKITEILTEGYKSMSYSEAINKTIKLILFSSKSTMVLNTNQLISLHEITTTKAINKLKTRSDILKNDISKPHPSIFTIELINSKIPSINNIKILRDGNTYTIIEGNGRIEAIKDAFGNVNIESEVYSLDNNLYRYCKLLTFIMFTLLITICYTLN